MDRPHRGDVFHCAVTESLTAAKVNSQIDALQREYLGDTYLETGRAT